MARCVLHIAGLILGGVGMVGTLAATAMPQWRVSAYVDGNIVVFETVWEGLWMDCISQLGLRLQCKFYDSVLALPPPLEAFRALMCLAAALAVAAFLAAIAGVTYTPRGKRGPGAVSTFVLAAGAAFLLTGTLVLIPVSWTGGSIVRDFYDPEVPVPLKRELGAALYVGWGSAALLLAAGAMHCHCWCGAGAATSPGHPRLARPAPGVHAYV
ncbi:claudin-8-like [Vidua macroura]|nr:claudin-8-like [Vidua macroura]